MTSLKELHNSGDCRWPCGSCLTDDERQWTYPDDWKVDDDGTD